MICCGKEFFDIVSIKSTTVGRRDSYVLQKGLQVTNIKIDFF